MRTELSGTFVSTASFAFDVYTEPIHRKGDSVMRRMMLLLLTAVCLMVGSPTAEAADNWGSIQVQLDTEDLPVINGAVTLHQVGVKVEEGYRIADRFGGGIIRMEDMDSDKLALWLAESADEGGITHLLDADGAAVFSELEQGLYMLVQTERIDGFYPIYPIILSIPQDNQWDAVIRRKPVPVVTEIPKTGQSIIPFLGILGMLLSSTGLLLCAVKNKKLK